jgi:SAM-dependent methyltransferase
MRLGRSRGRVRLRWQIDALAERARYMLFAVAEQALYQAMDRAEYAVGLNAGPDTAIPPLELMEYRESGDQHLETGKRNVETMLDVLAAADFRWEDCKRVLEFGCSNGKLVRWLTPYVANREIWGVDVQARKVMWAMENLSPPFRFATTTTVPHLPFPDGHFDLVFAGSVFTHIGELHVAWLAELARVIAPGGFLYITLHDETAIEVAAADPMRHARFNEQIDNSEFATLLESGDFGFVSIAPYGTAMLSQVMMSSAYVQSVAQPLRLVSAVPKAYAGFQTGYVFTMPRASAS